MRKLSLWCNIGTCNSICNNCVIFSLAVLYSTSVNLGIQVDCLCCIVCQSLSSIDCLLNSDVNDDCCQSCNIAPSGVICEFAQQSVCLDQATCRSVRIVWHLCLLFETCPQIPKTVTANWFDCLNSATFGTRFVEETNHQVYYYWLLCQRGSNTIHTAWNIHSKTDQGHV